MENDKSLPLPQELLVEILARLPVKSLVRFKCVSKSWLSLISDPHFAKSHYELAAHPTHTLIYLAPSRSQARALDLDASLQDDSVVAKFSFPLPMPSSGFRIRGSCRGFLLLDKHPYLYLWNPSTSVLKQVPYSVVSSTFYEFLDTLGFTIIYGFGYDASTDDYLIVIASLAHKSKTYPKIQLEFFSLRTNSWKGIEVTHFPYICPSIQCGLFFNGAIHWLVFSDYDTNEGVILAFDLTDRNLSEVPLPDSSSEYCFGDLMVIGGCLGVCYGSDFREVWVMKKYKVQSSWTKSFVMLGLPIEEFYSICLTKGGDIVGLNESFELVKLNEGGELLEDGAYCYEGQIAMYTESLLSLPPCDCGEVEEDGQP